jgi:hypothetical protein
MNINAGKFRCYWTFVPLRDRREIRLVEKIGKSWHPHAHENFGGRY